MSTPHYDSLHRFSIYGQNGKGLLAMELAVGQEEETGEQNYYLALLADPSSGHYPAFELALRNIEDIEELLSKLSDPKLFHETVLEYSDEEKGCRARLRFGMQTGEGQSHFAKVTHYDLKTGEQIPYPDDNAALGIMPLDKTSRDTLSESFASAQAAFAEFRQTLETGAGLND